MLNKLLALVLIGSTAFAAEVTMEKVPYGGWPNCVRLTNGTVELIATTDVGPRIIRFGFVGGQNMFKEFPDMIGKTGGEEWRIYGGHRFWSAPEAQPRTYFPDNAPVKAEMNGGADGASLTLTPPPETVNGLQKQMAIGMAPSGKVRVVHKMTNVGRWEIEVAPWALSVMANGGRAILPQEKFIPHTEYLLPARPLVLWHYTQLADPRWIWGNKYIQLRQDPNATTPQKAGLLNKQGWAAYALDGDLFVKRYEFDEDGKYPDFGVNTECFTNADILEVETLGPLTKLAPDGAVEHEEIWSLHKAQLAEDDASIDQALKGVL
jgi:hypothetical protein